MSKGYSTGQTVVVTGAAGGIGAAIAARFAAEARVLSLWDRESAVHAVAADLAQRAVDRAVAGGRDKAWDAAESVHGVEVDVCDAEAVRTAFDRFGAAHGPADVVVHAAGVMVGGNALELDAAEWTRCLTVNATATMLVTQRAATEMVAAGRGSIVVVSSNAAAMPRVNMAAYGAAKAAATAYTKALALQVAPLGVRVNLVSPGSTDTAMLREMFGGDRIDAAAETALLDGDPTVYRLGIPLRRIAAPADIAETVHFLASEGARHITMHDLRVDGGATLDM
ncbi:2,3-dihydro-2,3-dihydroxybenzoate dehydrogenase [Nocardia sp. MH4]|uniref:SDR family NAD(P)-dependent oxidoreductase n=1 Tax=unclassified Nocardia TaxID=2637762 RepID=UPI001C4E9819|nr:SDR family NAD(P)-dependent oxidoreductase [Nocardia sp. MH4]MBW0274567.1 2,3-dihydro-2,3-dihydroxybenzoate dehydrogenase [Nocardia sp. MH4]